MWSDNGGNRQKIEVIQFDLVGHGELFPNEDEQIVSLAKQKTFVTVWDIANRLRKTEAIVKERTMLE